MLLDFFGSNVFFSIAFLMISFLSLSVGYAHLTIIKLRKRVDFLEEALRDDICKYISKNLGD